jgi:DNA-binding NtrC family response regulator
LSILIVDDDPVVLKSCERILKEEGYKTILAGGTQEALDLMADNTFSLLLVDIKMPEKDGLYFIEQARAKNPDIPILVISGYPTEDTISRSIKLGAGGFLAKPFSPDELLEEVKSLFGKRRQRVQTRNILVIDDEQIVLDSVQKIMSSANYKTDLAASSRQGLEWAMNRDYDIVLSDIRMPEIGGMKILREIKRAKPSLPVIIFTGYATVKSAVQAMKLGAENYIEKPFTPDTLLEAVNTTLAKAGDREPEPQELIHKDEIIKVLERASEDGEFVSALFYAGADALEEYDLTGPEKLALLTGDIKWIESYTGPLTAVQRRWLEQRLSAEIW